MSQEEAGGRVFFSNVKRSLEEEDEIVLVSVGVDIGSSTSHLVFSRLVMERLDNRYIVSERVVLYESDVLLTPYAENQSIDARLLGAFIQAQYDNAGITSEKIDTGALILTGVAVRRSNARAIGELFAKDAGKFVSVSAGDALETTLAAFGSGAAALSIRLNQTVMNIDIGGGTTKMAVCVAGEVVDLTALDVGARIVAFDQNQQVCRLEEAAKMLAQECGFEIELGQVLAPEKRQGLVALMAHKIIEVAKSKQLSPHTRALLRLDALRHEHAPGILTFSGGVSEYIYSRQSEHFDDLGPQLAQEISKALQAQWPQIDVQTPEQGIRATVVGASQYTVQVSGSTIFVEPKGTLPLRNVPVIAPKLSLSEESIDSGAIAKEIKRALKRLDLSDSDNPVALCYKWGGSATFRRLDDFCKGVAKGFEALIAKGHPLMLIGEADCAGLIGIHCQEEIKVGVPVISVDGITLSELDFVDIGALLETSGAVPVVIKSLVFPVSAGLGKTGFQPT
ncbi:MAG: ethanolamine ammonia-lyase reactivating factor EutA [Burkholderiaceae bacterium]